MHEFHCINKKKCIFGIKIDHRTAPYIFSYEFIEILNDYRLKHLKSNLIQPFSIKTHNQKYLIIKFRTTKI